MNVATCPTEHLTSGFELAIKYAWDPTSSLMRNILLTPLLLPKLLFTQMSSVEIFELPWKFQKRFLSSPKNFEILHLKHISWCVPNKIETQRLLSYSHFRAGRPLLRLTFQRWLIILMPKSLRKLSHRLVLISVEIPQRLHKKQTSD